MAINISDPPSNDHINAFVPEYSYYFQFNRLGHISIELVDNIQIIIYYFTLIAAIVTSIFVVLCSSGFQDRFYHLGNLFKILYANYSHSLKLAKKAKISRILI